MQGRVRRVNGGVTVIEHLLIDKSSAIGPYRGATSLDTTFQEGGTLAQYEWQQAFASISISGLDELQNRGEHKMIDLLAFKTQQAELSLRDLVGKAALQTVGGFDQLIPLSSIINTTNIAGVTDSNFQSTVTASGAFASQGLADWRTLHNTVSASAGVDSPDFYLSTQTIFEAYEALLEPKERFTNTRLADAGIRNLEFKGIPFTYDQYVETGILYGLNSRYINLVIDSMRDFSTTDFVRPTNQDAKTALILLAFAQTTNNRRRFGKLTGVT